LETIDQVDKNEGVIMFLIPILESKS